MSGRTRAALVLAAALLLDVGARPLVPVPRKSTLFVRDAELGWRFRPSARDQWDGAPVEINAKGLRGPELEYARKPGTPRVLYLGDSVTVGYGLAGHAESYPYLTAQRLRAQGRPIETVNGAVNGYATWQEVGWFEREGLRYQPDLVLLGFVLNDVPDNWGPARRPDRPASKMLRLSVESGLDWLANRSSVVALGREAALEMRFGRDVRRGAEIEGLLAAQALAATPDRPDRQEAWAATFADLDRLRELCRARGIRLGLVVFPFTFQVAARTGVDDPQRRLLDYARSRDLPALDLLPLLRARAHSGDGLTAQDFFLDVDHPSVLGSSIVADRLVEFVVSEGLLPRAP